MRDIGTSLDQGSGGDNKIILSLLDVVDRDPMVTQRLVASELGIALGLANAYLKRCVRKGLVKVREIPKRRYAYYLTPQGFAEKSRLTATYLTESFSLFRIARRQFGELFAAALQRGHRRVALLGDGDLAEIAGLVARESTIMVTGTVPPSADAGQLARDVAALGPVDAVVVTALGGSFEVFSAALTAFGKDRVYAPELLRLQPPSGQPDQGAAS